MSRKVGNHGGGRWSSARQWTVSLLLVIHLLAVFVPPFTFQTSPVRGMGSPLAEAALDILRPYIDAAYLNHGYAFFAPDPGPSHLLRARLEFDDGREPLELTFPDRQQHWPRLLYHRHFMLSEHLNGAFAAAGASRDVAEDPERLAQWKYVRDLYERRRAAIGQHLAHRYGATSVRLTRIEHRLLEPYEFAVLGEKLDAADTFFELPEIAEVEEGP